MLYFNVRIKLKPLSRWILKGKTNIGLYYCTGRVAIKIIIIFGSDNTE